MSSQKNTLSKNFIIDQLLTVFLPMLIASVICTMLITKKTVIVVIDGQAKKYVTFKNTVGEALTEKKINLAEKDKIKPSLDTKILKKDTIEIKRAVGIAVAVDGKELKIQSAEENVEAFLNAEGITLRAQDKIQPETTSKLYDGLQVKIVRVDKKTFTDSSSLDFATVIKYDNNLANTQRRTSQEGKQGERQIVTDVTYEDNVEVARKIVSDSVVKQPVDKIIVQGTYPVMPISRGGEPVPYSSSFKARATAYWAVNGVGRTYTYSGRLAVRNPEGYSTVAVDPKVIPLGTRLFIENYGFAIAADTGSAVLGNTVDVYFNTYQEAINWAVKYVNVYILK